MRDVMLNKLGSHTNHYWVMIWILIGYSRLAVLCQWNLLRRIDLRAWQPGCCLWGQFSLAALVFLRYTCGLKLLFVLNNNLHAEIYCWLCFPAYQTLWVKYQILLMQMYQKYMICKRIDWRQPFLHCPELMCLYTVK